MVEQGPVRQIIQERKQSASRPGYRQDGFKVGLVVEGGAMRSVVSGGETLAFSHLGLLPTIDAVYGVSAGSAVAAYLLASQAESISIFFRDINNERFLNPKRFLKGNPPMLDLFFLTHHIMKKTKPLDWRRVVDSPQQLHIFVTNAKTGQAIDLNRFTSQEELLLAIHGSCRIPLVAGMPLKIDDQTHYADGGVTTGGGLAVEAAIADGCSHVLVLQSKPDQETYDHRLDPLYLLAYCFLKPEYPALARAVLKMKSDYARNCELIKASEKKSRRFPYIEGVRVPKDTPEVSIFETNARRLLAGAQTGKRTVYTKFSPKA